MFYATHIEIIRPAKKDAGRYGYGTGTDEYSYDPAEGAEVIPVPASGGAATDNEC